LSDRRAAIHIDSMPQLDRHIAASLIHIGAVLCDVTVLKDAAGS
jgi:hypothetical protein